MRVLLVLIPIAAAAVFALVARRGTAAPMPSSAELPPLPAAIYDFALPGDDPAPVLESIASAVVHPVVETFSAMGSAVSSTVRKIFALPAAAERYRETIAAAEEKYGIPSSLLGRLLYQESRFRPEIIDGSVSSPAGALGIAQFMPATAAEQGVDPLDPAQAIPGAARYLRRLYDSLGDWGKALAAYNWGIGNVKRKGMEKAPTETRLYVSQILNDVEV